MELFLELRLAGAADELKKVEAQTVEHEVRSLDFLRIAPRGMRRIPQATMGSLNPPIGEIC